MIKAHCGLRSPWVAACLTSYWASAVLMASAGQTVDVPERLQGAARAVVATVTAVNAEWRQNSHGDQLIISRIRLQVEETLKGKAENDIWLEVEGGTLGGVTLRVSSQAELRAGERAIFFLDTAGSPATYVPHLKGLGVLKLDDQNRVKDSSLRLDDIRQLARGPVR